MKGFDVRSLFDALAPFYESHWGRAFLEHSIHLFRRKLAPQLKRGDLVLELCCGTGHFAQWLAEQGYRVTGIDGSRGMLRYARKRLRSGQLLQADVRHFHLYHRANAIVCFYNSLNQFLATVGSISPGVLEFETSIAPIGAK